MSIKICVVFTQCRETRLRHSIITNLKWTHNKLLMLKYHSKVRDRDIKTKWEQTLVKVGYLIPSLNMAQPTDVKRWWLYIYKYGSSVTSSLNN